MIFEEPGKRFELRLTDYEFPEIVDSELDSNWLDVAISVRVPDGSYSASSPCLETLAVVRMVEWLDNIAHDVPQRREIGFTEPNLGFEHVLTAGDMVTLRIRAEQEFGPPWMDVLDEFTMDFVVPRSQIAEAAASLWAQLQLFPPRAGDETRLPRPF